MSEFNMKDNMNYNPPEYIKVKTYHNVIQNITENNYNYAPLFNENHMNYSEINIKNNMNYNSPNYSKVNTSQNNHGINNKNSGKDIHENEKEISSHLNKDNEKRVNILNANSKKEKESIIFGKNNINNTADNILSKLPRNANSIIINKKEDLNQENQSELLNQKKDISSNFNNKFDSNKIEDNINMNKKVDEEVESIDILYYNKNWFRLSNEDYEDNELNEAFLEEAKDEISNNNHNNTIDLKDIKKEQNLNNAFIKNTSKKDNNNFGFNRMHFNIINSGQNSYNEKKLHNNISEIPEKDNSINSNNGKIGNYKHQSIQNNSIVKKNDFYDKEKPNTVNIDSEEKIIQNLIQNFIIKKNSLYLDYLIHI